MQDGVAILRVPSFDKGVFEQSAVEYLRKLGPVRAVVLDLRGNHGGSTPESLLDALMDRPFAIGPNLLRPPSDFSKSKTETAAVPS